ncbi:unnamed protein product [Rhodiola kirilowii]
MVNYGCVGQDLKWVVKTKTSTGVAVEQIFDAQLSWPTGHYTQPRLSIIKGMDTWRRKQIHSHIYRDPAPFRDEVVVVVGNSLSGQDISMELVDVAKEVHVCMRNVILKGSSAKNEKKLNTEFIVVRIRMILLHSRNRAGFIDIN